MVVGGDGTGGTVAVDLVAVDLVAAGLVGMALVDTDLVGTVSAQRDLEEIIRRELEPRTEFRI